MLLPQLLGNWKYRGLTQCLAWFHLFFEKVILVVVTRWGRQKQGEEEEGTWDDSGDSEGGFPWLIVTEAKWQLPGITFIL
jgi:hypothetical protein